MQYSSPQQVMDEIGELVPSYERFTLTSFDKEDLEWADVENDRLEAKRLYRGQFPNGFGRFSAAEYVPQPDISKNGYQMTLLSGSVLYHFGGGTRSSRSSRLNRFSPRAWVEISRVDAGRLGFSEGDIARVISPAGEVTITIRLTDTLPPGMLFMPASFLEGRELFDIALDHRAKGPSLKACPARLERISTDG
jgi:predicted molibdopterin-dependent oxidoreductase YjgC